MNMDDKAAKKSQENKEDQDDSIVPSRFIKFQILFLSMKMVDTAAKNSQKNKEYQDDSIMSSTSTDQGVPSSNPNDLDADETQSTCSGMYTFVILFEGSYIQELEGREQHTCIVCLSICHHSYGTDFDNTWLLHWTIDMIEYIKLS